MYESRITLLRKYLSQNNLDGFIVSKKENLQYLLGLKTIDPTSREALLFISQNKLVLYHSRLLTPPQAEGLISIPMSHPNALLESLNTAFVSASRIGFESKSLTYAEYDRLKTTFNTPEYIPYTDVIETMRLVKDSGEIKDITKACQIAKKTMNWIISYLRQNSCSQLTEKAIAHTIENRLYELGAEDLAFPTIVAFNANSSKPHHQPTSKKLTPESIVLMDFGCKVNGYCSDMTRTIKLGRVDKSFDKIKSIVDSAYAQSLDILKSYILNPKSPLLASEIDQAARNYITEKGYGDKFIHSTGHGLGLEIHEPPSLYHLNPQALSENFVFTLEPGVYIPKKFGYRYENTLHYTNKGVKELTK